MACARSISVIDDDGAEAVVQVVEPTGSEIQIVANLGGVEIIAAFRQRHPFKPGDKIRLKPDPAVCPFIRRSFGTTSQLTKTQRRNDHDDDYSPHS